MHQMPTYGVKTQYAPKDDLSAPLDAQAIDCIQKIIGSLLYYGWVVHPTILVALGISAAQQNNSAIAEMVSSRDSLIDELNDRVAVFEEDKVVLKAALRQLQKEMKEEAPKTQKLVEDINEAQSSKFASSLIKDVQLIYRLIRYSFYSPLAT